MGDRETLSSRFNCRDQKPTSKQPIRTCYLGHVTGYQPIRDQCSLIRSLIQSSRNLVPLDRYRTTNQNSLLRSRDWLTANQGLVFPDWVLPLDSI
eukprot:sb/3479307/